MTKPLFLYATGTAFFTQILGTNIGAIGGGEGTMVKRNDKAFRMSYIYQDPFPWMLNEQVWDARKVAYPASVFPMGASIDTGVAMTIAHIKTTPAGTPFFLGGYSQGAAVMSKTYRQITSSTGELYSRRNDFKGAVLFGNPMRQQDFTAPGVTWSGAWDVPGSTTGGSGCFPDRLSNCEYGKWREYVNYNEIITATGTSSIGAGWRSLVGYLTGMSNPLEVIQGALTTDWAGGLQGIQAIGDWGHVRYPLLPPLSAMTSALTTTDKTCYDLALDFLETTVQETAVTPILPITDPSLDHQWTTYRPIPAS